MSHGPNDQTLTNGYIKLSVITGIIMGIVGGTPYLNLINCCFIVYLGGGFLATYLFSKRTTVLNLSDSLVIGIIAGFACGVTMNVYDLVFRLLGFNQAVHMLEVMMDFFEKLELPAEVAIQLNEQFMEQMEIAKSMTAADRIRAALYSIMFSIVFTVIGSLIGGLLFKKDIDLLSDNGPDNQSNIE